jgi:hypothetical protein
MKRRLLLFFLLVSSLVTAQNNIYRSGGITQTVGAPTFTPGASGNIVAIDTVTGEWYVNPNRLSGSSWISAGYRLTNISGSVPPAYTPTAHQSHFVVNAANQLYYWNGSSWQSVGGGGGSTDALRLKFIVVNKSGGTLNKGEVVYVSGAQGNRVAVKKALASADSLSANTLGVMDETVANNGEGYCVAEGLISGINTSAFTEGAALYLSPTTAGAITQTKPTAPNHLVLIGYCVKSNNGSGEISVHIQNGYELGELHDVYVPAPSNGQVLTYNTTNTRWEAATVADQSATNELQTIDTFSLSGQTLSASLSSDSQPAKTVTLPVTNVTAGTGISVSSTTGNYTVTNSAPDQTVSIANGGGIGVTGSYPSFTLTATDQSITNEIQRLDTFSLSGQTLSASLLNDGVAASSVTLPIVDVVAGTNVTVSKSNGVATVSATGGGGGGTPAGSTGEIQYNNAGAFGASANLAWDNTAVQLNIGAPSLPTGKLNVKGSGTLTTVNTRLTNSGNTELVKVLDNGNTNIGTGFNWDNVNKSLSLGQTSVNNFPLELRSARATAQFFSSGLSTPIPFTGLTFINGETVYQINQAFGAGGGVAFNGLTNSDLTPVNFSGFVGATSTTVPAIFFRGFKLSGNTSTALTGTEKISDFSNGSSVVMGIRANGNINVGSDFTPSATVHVRGSNTTAGVGAFLVQDGAATPVTIYRIDNDGKVTYRATNTAAGTTGAQTINRPSGTVNFAAGATSLVVTNSLCTTASIVLPVIRTNDATATIKNVVPAAGSFTINLGAAATAETSVGFFIIN